MASVFDPRVVDGWRDPRPPVSTPGVVISLERRVTQLLGTTNLVPDLSPRVAPHYVSGTADLYLAGVRISHVAGGTVTIHLQGAGGVAGAFTAAARAALAIVARVGADEVFIPLSGIPVAQTVSPYTITPQAAGETWARAVATNDGAVIQVALVDTSAGNVERTEVTDPLPRFIPFAPVVEPVGMFDEAAEGVAGLVWRHTRRTRIAVADGRTAIVDASRPAALAQANAPITGDYVSGGGVAYVTRLDVSDSEVRLFVQSSPTSGAQSSTSVSLDLSFLALVIQSPTGTRWQAELADFTLAPDDVPGLYRFRTIVPLTVRGVLGQGAATAALVDTRSPNVNLTDYQFRRLAGVEDDYTIELTSRHVGVRTRARLSVRKAADPNIVIDLLAEEAITTTARVTRTPYTGPPPGALPTIVEVREIPDTGAYRTRRWIDHTSDFASLSWARAIGSAAQASGKITQRDGPAGVYEGAADPEFVGRAISQRFLVSGEVALTFPVALAAAHLRPGDGALVDGVTVSPAGTPEYEVTTRASRGGQRFSVFDATTVSPTAVSGVRVQVSGLAFGATLPVGDVDVLGATISSVSLTPTSIIINLSGTLEARRAVVDRHAAFVRAGGESWGVSLEGARLQEGVLAAEIPESERGNLLTIIGRRTFSMAFALVETRDAPAPAGEVNPRVSIGRREIALRTGDSIFTAVEPAAPGVPRYAGLVARTSRTVAVTTLPVTLSDLSQRFEVAPDRFVAGIRLVTGGRMEVDVQDRYGRAQTLSAGDLERLSVVARVSTVARRFRLNDGAYAAGTYTIGGAEGLRDEILFVLQVAPEAVATVTTLVVDAGYYALAADGLTLGSNDGDFYEVALRPGLVPRSRTVRYTVSLPPVRAALSVFDSAAAADLRGQYLAVDPVGDGTVENVTGILLVQNDTVGFANLNDGTSYIHRLLIAHSPQATGPNAGRHQIAIIFSEVAGATSPATPPDDAALDGLVLAMRFRRGAEEVVIQYSVDTSDAARDAAGEQAIVDHVDVPTGYDNASAPDDFDLAVVDPGRGYDADTQTLPGTAIPYPRVALAPARTIRPWVPPDGAEFRILLNLWTSQKSAATALSTARIRLAVPGSGPLTSGTVAATPGNPVRARRDFNPSAIDDVMRDRSWQFTTPNGSDVDLQEIIVGPGGTSLAFEPGGQFNDADYADLAIVFEFGRGDPARYIAGFLLSEFTRTSATQWDISGAASWRAQAVAALAARARTVVAIVDTTVAGVDVTTWTWMHAHDGDLPPLSPADRILVTDGIALLDGADPRDTPIQIIDFDPLDRWIDIEHEPGIALLGQRVTWQRSIDRRPVFGGWWINPKAKHVPGRPGTQQVSVSGVDYSAVTDRRLHGGGRLVSRAGETVGNFMARMLEQWETGIPGIGPEGLGDNIDRTLGGALEPPFDTEQAGGTRSSWRSLLDALQERAQGLAGWQVDAGKRLVWQPHGAYTGLTLTHTDDYQNLDTQEDRNRSRNAVDVRAEPESTILVTADDPVFIASRARVEGGTGRYEAVADSPQGNEVGERIARQHADDQLARYPFLYRRTIRCLSHDDYDYGQMIRLFELRPGDAFRLIGAHLPAVANVRTTVIATRVLYVEDAGGGALPAAVTVGSVLRIGGPGGPAVEVIGGGGPRGSVWCLIPEGVTIAPSLSTPADLIEQLLCETISITVVPSGGPDNAPFVLSWSIVGMRPRIGSGVGRGQTGWVGRWKAAITGAAG